MFFGTVLGFPHWSDLDVVSHLDPDDDDDDDYKPTPDQPPTTATDPGTLRAIREPRRDRPPGFCFIDAPVPHLK